MKPIQNNRQVETAQQIDALLDSHRNWVDRLNRALICRTAPGEDLIAEDAHSSCALGQLLGAQNQNLFPDPETFERIGILHKSVHDIARTMLNDVRSTGKVPVDTYDMFLSAINTLQGLIEHVYDNVVDTINTTDPLTGAQNRSHMPGLLEERISETQKGIMSWVLMVDLDHFKSINDRFGHEFGDRVLKGFSAVVRDHIRTRDLFFRYGGEEFVICISDANYSMIDKVAERLRIAVSQKTFEAPNGDTFSVTASFGVVQLSPGIGANEAIHAADKAMYAAKHAGRNKVMFHSELDNQLPT